LDPRLRLHRLHLQATWVPLTALRRTPRPLTRSKGPLKDPVRLAGHLLARHSPPASNWQPRPGPTSDRAGRAPLRAIAPAPLARAAHADFGGRRLCQCPPLFDNALCELPALGQAESGVGVEFIRFLVGLWLLGTSQPRRGRMTQRAQKLHLAPPVCRRPTRLEGSGADRARSSPLPRRRGSVRGSV
jgi:hypothetical protein